MQIIRSLTSDTRSLMQEWGWRACACIMPLVIGAYAIETFATEPLVDVWYADGTVRQLKAVRLLALAFAEAWTFLTSGYGVI